MEFFRPEGEKGGGGKGGKGEATPSTGVGGNSNSIEIAGRGIKRRGGGATQALLAIIDSSMRGGKAQESIVKY